MPLDQTDIDAVSEFFNRNAEGDPAYWLFHFIGPPGPSLVSLVQFLEKQSVANGAQMSAVIAHAAVEFGLRGVDGATGRVVGMLAHDHTASGQRPNKFDAAIKDLNGQQPVKIQLASVTVESRDLQQLRADWIECARRLGLGQSDSERAAAADTVKFSVDLRKLKIGPKPGCRGLSCPATPKLSSG